jgi:hypothetical protein
MSPGHRKVSGRAAIPARPHRRSTGPILPGTYFRHPKSAVLAAVAVIGLGASGWLGFGYMHYQRLAVARETALQRLEGANLDLQDTLKQLRDEIEMNRDEAAVERDGLRHA